eukprot:g29554.t1
MFVSGGLDYFYTIIQLFLRDYFRCMLDAVCTLMVIGQFFGFKTCLQWPAHSRPLGSAVCFGIDHWIVLWMWRKKKSMTP